MELNKLLHITASRGAKSVVSHKSHLLPNSFIYSVSTGDSVINIHRSSNHWGTLAPFDIVSHLFLSSLPKPSTILSNGICKPWHLLTYIFPLWVLVENLTASWEFTFRTGCVLEFSNTSIRPQLPSQICILFLSSQRSIFT